MNDSQTMIRGGNLRLWLNCPVASAQIQAPNDGGTCIQDMLASFFNKESMWRHIIHLYLSQSAQQSLAQRHLYSKWLKRYCMRSVNCSIIWKRVKVKVLWL